MDEPQLTHGMFSRFQDGRSILIDDLDEGHVDLELVKAVIIGDDAFAASLGQSVF